MIIESTPTAAVATAAGDDGDEYDAKGKSSVRLQTTKRAKEAFNLD